MKELLEKYSPSKRFKAGDIVEGIVVGKGRSALYIDLGAFSPGVIFGKEYQIAKDLLRRVKNGDKVMAKIVSLENDDGYIELSANDAGLELAWDTLKEKKDNEDIIKVKVVGANKGGLLAKLMNIPAFLPVSQLSSKNYPKVEGGNTSKILQELQKFIGKEMDVKILDFSKKDEKLILSEKIKEMEKTKELLKEYQAGDIVEGEITGIADFGAFISFGDGVDGLIHISEMAWQIIKSPSEVVKEGDKVNAQIIEISNDRVFLSLKSLRNNPWDKIKDKYKIGDIVKGKVSKINPFGAFIQLISSKDLESGKIQGLCHVSEFGTIEKMSEELLPEKEYSFEIVSLEPEEHRMILKLAR